MTVPGRFYYQRRRDFGVATVRTPLKDDRKYPLQPLLDVLHVDSLWRRSDTAWKVDTARRLGVSDSAFLKWSRHGIPWFMADEVAQRVGVHPGLVWPEWWQQ